MREGADYFLRPSDPAHRRYAALRAYFVDGKSADEVAETFGYTPGTIRVWASNLRKGKLNPFYATGKPGPQPQDRDASLVQAVLELRRDKLNVYEISDRLTKQGYQAGHTLVWRILKEAGSPRLPKRTRKEKPNTKLLPTQVADINHLDLTTGRTMECRAPLLFVFAPLLEDLAFDTIVHESGYPGTSMIPPTQAVRSLLTMKLMQESRRNHAIDIAEDEGLGLFAGLNVLPKNTKIHDYSYEVPGECHQKLQVKTLQRIHKMGFLPTHSLNIDTHTIRHHGEKAVLEKNYVPRRSQSTKSILAVYAQELGSRTLVYADADTLKEENVEQVTRVIDYWKQIAGKEPDEVVIDSRLTTNEGLAELDGRGIKFITLRSRHPAWIKRVEELPASAWKRARVDVKGRKYKNPRVLDERVKIKGYPGEVRQIVAKDMGKEKPMFLLTNDFDAAPGSLLTRYALRTPVENAIAEQVEFFHSDALSSDVRAKVDMDIVLDVVASQLYNWFRSHLRGFEKSTAGVIWRKFLDRPGSVRIEEDAVVVRVRAFNVAPVLMESGLLEQDRPVSWLDGRRVRVEFGR